MTRHVVQIDGNEKEQPRTGTEVKPENKASEKRVLITAAHTSTEVLKYDAEGYEIMFDPKNFLRLEQDIVEQLSRKVKADYNRTRTFADTLKSDEDAELMRRFTVDKEFAGTAQERLGDLQVRPGLRHRWITPNSLSKRERVGWRLATADDAKSYLGTTHNRHEIVRDGKTELILVVMPESIGKINDAKKAQRLKESVNRSDQDGLAKLAENGVQGFIDKSSRSDMEYDELNPEQ